jgi:hypothetical protein
MTGSRIFCQRGSSVMKAVRQGALDAIRRALRLEPRMISLFRLTWDPNDPTKVSSEENDLEVLHTDEEFKRMLAPDVNVASTDCQERFGHPILEIAFLAALFS